MLADRSLWRMILRWQIENLTHGLEDRGRLTSCSNGQQHFHGRPWSTFSRMPRLSDSTTFSWSELRLPRRLRTRRISLRRTASKRSLNEIIVPETSESRTGELPIIALVNFDSLPRMESNRMATTDTRTLASTTESCYTKRK